MVAALVLFVCSKRFAVYEDPRIAQVNELLPGANCGGCGFAGCGGMADALVKGADAGSLEGLNCPVGGSEVMGRVADLLGMAIANGEPKIAVVRCNGSCEVRPKIAEYAGMRSCAAMHACGAGETACGFGCLGCGDCETACQFGAIKVNPETGIPEVDEEKCTSWRHHRTAEERPERPPCLRFLCEQRQGRSFEESLRGELHRLWQVCEGMSVRGYHSRTEPVLYRFQQMPAVSQVCQRLSYPRHSRRQFPRSQTC